jgi:hypothetical protein
MQQAPFFLGFLFQTSYEGKSIPREALGLQGSHFSLPNEVKGEMLSV